MNGGDENNHDMGFQSHVFASAWDQVGSLGQHPNFGDLPMVSQSGVANSTYPVAMGNHGVNYSSDPSFAEMVPKFPSYGSGNFTEIVGSLGINESGHISNAGFSQNFASNIHEANNDMDVSRTVLSQHDHQLSEEAATGPSAHVKRRKRIAESNSPFDPSKNDNGEPYDENEKNSATDPSNVSNLRSKQGKGTSPDGEAPKENYIHVRARRGQATNSHSLAERVRREKISERMRMLQELVPGCNKITGKAVMLDEIINYVQSLQQQVEFLSMKLATVNPELNIDIERLLSKDILHSRSSNTALLGTNPHLYSNSMFEPSTPIFTNTNPQFTSMPLTALDNELHSLYQMGFDSSSAIDTLGAAGRLKSEL